MKTSSDITRDEALIACAMLPSVLGTTYPWEQTAPLIVLDITWNTALRRARRMLETMPPDFRAALGQQRDAEADAEPDPINDLSLEAQIVEAKCVSDYFQREVGVLREQVASLESALKSPATTAKSDEARNAEDAMTCNSEFYSPLHGTHKCSFVAGHKGLCSFQPLSSLKIVEPATTATGRPESIEYRMTETDRQYLVRVENELAAQESRAREIEGKLAFERERADAAERKRESVIDYNERLHGLIDRSEAELKAIRDAIPECFFWHDEGGDLLKAVKHVVEGNTNLCARPPEHEVAALRAQFEAKERELKDAKKRAAECTGNALAHPQSLIDAGWVPREAMQESLWVGPHSILNLREMNDAQIASWLASRSKSAADATETRK